MLVKCNCQICSGHLEFESSNSGQTIACPHCGMDTVLYIPDLPKPNIRIVSKQGAPAKSGQVPTSCNQHLEPVTFSSSRSLLYSFITFCAGIVATVVVLFAMSYRGANIKKSASETNNPNLSTHGTPTENVTTAIEKPSLINIDIINGTISGIKVKDINIDKLTDLFGKPTVCKLIKPGNKHFNWRQLGWPVLSASYAELGLEFVFNSPTNTCNGMCVYLDDVYDDVAGVRFSHYNGTLTKNISNEWKVNKILDVFANYKLISERQDNWTDKAEVIDEILQTENPYYTFFTVPGNYSSVLVKFEYDINTKYLHKVIIK